MNPKPESFETSREAYEWCVANGIVSQRVAEVLKVLSEGGPMNQTMAHQAVVRATGNVALAKYSVSPRFAVLERMGLIRNIGRNLCPVTQRSTIFYDVTCKAPTCTEAEALNAADRREMVSTLKAEIVELKKEVEQLRELLNMRSASHAERERRIKSTPVVVQTSFL